MSRIYRKYLKLLEKWPVDPTKKGRDLGAYIREEVKRNFGSGTNFAGNEQQCEDNYVILKRIADNHYFEQYPRIYKSSGSGLNCEECALALSDNFLEYLEDEQEPRTSKWLKSLTWPKFSTPNK